MAFLQRFLKYITLINEQLGKIAGWVALAMVLIVTLDVIMRYLFNLTFVCVQELEWHLFGVLFLLGAGYTLAHDGHVRVDIFYQRLNKRQQAWINLIGVIVFLLPGCFLVVDTTYNFFLNSLHMQEGSPDPGGLPARYVLKFFIPFSFVMVGLQGVALGLKSLLIILGHEEEESK